MVKPLQEFRVDIVSKDNKTIIHHKVATRVVCVCSEQDAAVAGWAEDHAREAYVSLFSFRV
jgi:hypothetical protein